MSKFIILLIFGFVIAPFADDYRSFTDKDGRTIKAKVLKVDLLTKKVTLERENKKKATVPISLFSESDQKYIRSWSPTSKPDEPKSDQSRRPPIARSKSDSRKIVEQYKKASKKGESKRTNYPGGYSPSRRAKDYAELVALFENKTIEDLAKIKGGAISAASGGRVVDQIKLKKVEGPYIRIQIKFSDVSDHGNLSYPNLEGYLFLLDNGKIKYDPLYFQHPLQRAFGIIQSIERLCRRQSELLGKESSEKEIKTQDFIWGRQLDLLNEIGIPSFGLNKDQSAFEQKENLKKCITWLVEESRTWDTGEPKIPLPEELFEELLDISGFK